MLSKGFLNMGNMVQARPSVFCNPWAVPQPGPRFSLQSQPPSLPRGLLCSFQAGLLIILWYASHMPTSVTPATSLFPISPPPTLEPSPPLLHPDTMHPWEKAQVPPLPRCHPWLSQPTVFLSFLQPTHTLYLLWDESCLLERYAGVLIPGSSDCDLIWE